MTQIAILIPAAGASRRLAPRDKLLEPVDGAPLLRGVALRALQVSDMVLVTLPAQPNRRETALEDLAVKTVAVPDAADGMSASLRRGAQLLSDRINGLMILPADMPDLTVDDLCRVRDGFVNSGAQHIVQGTSATGQRGHPVLFPKDLIPAFEGLTGDSGARAILNANSSRVRRVALANDHATTDLDTPAAWRAWRSSNPDR